MTVSLEHRGTSSVVVHGVDTTEALAHLCRSLEQGSGPDARVVVIDLTHAPLVAEAASRTLGTASNALARSRRWLGVVEPVHATAAGEADAWYRTCQAALAAGDRYLSFVTGETETHPRLGMLFTAAVNTLSWLPGISLAVTRGLWRRIYARPQGPSSNGE